MLQAGLRQTIGGEPHPQAAAPAEDRLPEVLSGSNGIVTGLGHRQRKQLIHNRSWIDLCIRLEWKGNGGGLNRPWLSLGDPPAHPREGWLRDGRQALHVRSTRWSRHNRVRKATSGVAIQIRAHQRRHQQDDRGSGKHGLEVRRMLHRENPQCRTRERRTDPLGRGIDSAGLTSLREGHSCTAWLAATGQATSGAQPRCRAMSSVQQGQRRVRCSPWAIRPWCS